MRPKFLFVSLLVLSLWSTAQETSDGGNNWKEVEQAMARPGQPQPGVVMRFALPRKDLRVTLSGVAIQPGLALGSWIAFLRHGNEAMVMGDLVLLEDEISPVMVSLQKAGVQEAALHNHL